MKFKIGDTVKTKASFGNMRAIVITYFSRRDKILKLEFLPPYDKTYSNLWHEINLELDVLAYIKEKKNAKV